MKISFQANWIFVVKLYKFKTVWFKVFIAVAWFTLFLNVWLCLNQLYYWHGKLLMTVSYNGWRITRKNEWMSLCENLWRKTLLSHAFLLTLWRFSKIIFFLCVWNPGESCEFPEIFPWQGNIQHKLCLQKRYCQNIA